MHGASKDGMDREFIIYSFALNVALQYRSCAFRPAALILIGACRLRVGTLAA